jgi:rhodanese-related sulfurtransferase
MARSHDPISTPDRNSASLPVPHIAGDVPRAETNEYERAGRKKFRNPDLHAVARYINYPSHAPLVPNGIKGRHKRGSVSVDPRFSATLSLSRREPWLVPCRAGNCRQFAFALREDRNRRPGTGEVSLNG